MELTELRHDVRATLEDPSLTYRQRIQQLANLAENMLEPPAVSEACRQALNERVICDMYEGNAPYRPRYLLPDYASALANGSPYLELDPPKNLDEAVAFLLALYSQVPSITGYPVYIGDIDMLLEPFCEGVGDAELAATLRLFWIAIDRAMPDAFTHANLGPDDSRVGRTILAIERELLQVVPNLTLKVEAARTPDDYLLDAVRTVFACGKPHFVNHPMMTADLGERYGVASCYNSLPVGGGAHTLVRLNLKEVANRHHGDVASFLSETLPSYVALTAELAAARIRHLVEDARFFEHSWLVDEGLISLDRFSAMFGIFGLAEAVNLLHERAGEAGTYGHEAAANELGLALVNRVDELVSAITLPYCEGNSGHAFLHSQAGLDSDKGVTAGTRIPVGTEPPLHQHLLAVAPLHMRFPSGVSDVLQFDDTVVRNPQAVVDIIRGAFAQGMRDVTFNLDSNDFIRITGYLVRKSDLAKLAEQGARHGSTFLAAGSVANSKVTARSVKRVTSAESSPRAAR